MKKKKKKPNIPLIPPFLREIIEYNGNTVTLYILYIYYNMSGQRSLFSLFLKNSIYKYLTRVQDRTTIVFYNLFIFTILTIGMFLTSNGSKYLSFKF